jgi:hypothetical protein
MVHRFRAARCNRTLMSSQDETDSAVTGLAGNSAFLFSPSNSLDL